MGWITDESPWCPTHFFGTHLTKPRDRGAFLFPKAKKMTNIKFDAHNYRTHDEKNLKLIKKSLKELGAGRSIVIDSEGEIIAGNATYKQARELGLPVQVIETDGKRLIVVKRTDLKTQDKKRKRLALMDNSTSDKVQWDFDHIAADFEKGVKLYKWLWNGLCRKGERKIEGKSRVHPTQKPVGLIVNILKDFSSDNEIIFDGFGGSGTTLIACEQLGRKARLMEIDPHYCDVIITRWERLTGKQARLLEA